MLSQNLQEASQLLYFSQPSSVQCHAEATMVRLQTPIDVANNAPAAFLQSQIEQPFRFARMLLNLHEVVRSRFHLTPGQVAALRDPVVSVGANRLRFEGFSQCAGVYARADFSLSATNVPYTPGTTNVDFNDPMLMALSQIQPQQVVMLTVGQQALELNTPQQHVIEKKVKLPLRWVKSMAHVQTYLAKAEQVASLNRVQATHLIKNLPAGKAAQVYTLHLQGTIPRISTGAATGSGIRLGGAGRLRLLLPLLPYADSLQVYTDTEMQAIHWLLQWGDASFLLSLSYDPWRGFSGEGVALNPLPETMLQPFLNDLSKMARTHQCFNVPLFAMENDISLQQADDMAAQLGALGLLGFDLQRNEYYYRYLPYQTQKLWQLHPRLKAAEKLLTEDAVQILHNHEARCEALVNGSGVKHVVTLDGENARCTCTWHANHQGKRGWCKHILAVKRKQEKNNL